MKIRPIDSLNRTKLKIAPSGTVFITDDVDPNLGDYNCLGFVLGIRHFFRIDSDRDTPRTLLKRIGFREVGPNGKVVLYRQDDRHGWHVAKRLGGDWFESKCAEGPRIVHHLDSFTDDGWGKADSYWEFDGSEFAIHKLKVAIWEDTGGPIDALEPVHDSARLLLAYLLDANNSAAPKSGTAPEPL